MEVKLTPDQKAFVRNAIESGRLQREEDAVQEALALWEERERIRAEILAAVDEADASLAHGEGRIITQQSMLDLAADAKQRGRARLAAERPLMADCAQYFLNREKSRFLASLGMTIRLFFTPSTGAAVLRPYR